MPRKQARKCYFGCLVTDGPLHRFLKWEYPHEEKFNAWKAVLSEDTKSKGNNYIYNNIWLCDNHFEEKFKSPSHRLTTNAIPTLNIVQPRRDVDQVVIAPSPVSVTTNNMSLNTNYSQAQPSTSYQEPTLIDVASGINVCSAATCVKRPVFSKIDNALKKLKSRVEQLKKKCKNTKQKLKLADKLAKNPSFLKYIKELPIPIQIFTNLQLKYKKKPKGRRFELNEKIMALSIYKQSPKAYKILKKMFVLPSKRLLQKMLAGFSLRPGTNKDILLSLKKTVDKMPSEKRIVTLMFDEVALAPGLLYNPALEEIVGFEDLGSKKNKVIADHALVFMIKGIKSKTKQPICFTFCNANTKKNKN